jgi:hypothetical protein
MPRAPQLDFFTKLSDRGLKDHARRLIHGSDTRKGKRKLARPIDPKRPMHLVLRSERAKGPWSMLRVANERAIERIIWRAAAENRVRIYRYANSGNHLHLLVRAKTRRGFQDFARTIGALVARAVTGAKKGNPSGKFWDGLLYSRIVEWGKAYFEAKYYVIRNELEGLGFIARDRKIAKPDRGLNAGNGAQAPPVTRGPVRLA